MKQEQIQMRIDEQRLEKINKGHNFYNLEQREKKYFIEVMLDTSIDLLEKEEEIRVETDLPMGIRGWNNLRSQDVIDFFKEFENFVKKPLVKIRTSNRKNTIDSWKLDSIKENFRDRTLKFSDINISIGELAKKKLKAIEINDFEGKVKKLLDLQQTTGEETQKQVDRFVQLREKMLILKDLVGKNIDDYYGYGWDRKKDDTIKLTLTSLEYNEKLKEIEIEIREIAKKLNIKNIGDFDYLKIQKNIGYDEWLKTNKEDLEMNFNQYNDEYDDDEEKPYKNFDDYAEQMYDENGGVIEVKWEGIPKTNQTEEEDDFDDEDY